MTMIGSSVARAALASLLLAGGCAQLRAANATPAVPMEGKLTATLQQAEREASALRFGMADRLLADFAETHANTPEAMETAYWRALFRLDPSNQTASPRDAIALLDSYLGSSVAIAHPGSATALRRAAAALDRPAAVASGPVTSGAAPSRAEARPDDKSRDEEVQRLKDELAKATAELERIKKRLSQPNP
jgi:hypothetical protein